MMNRKTFTIAWAMLAAVDVAFVTTSCQNEAEENLPVESVADTPVTYVMRLEGGIRDFDSSATRAAEEWEGGSSLTIQFLSGDSRTVGSASYNSSKDEWTLTAQKALTAEVEERCEVYYFDNPTRTTDQSVSIGANTISYGDRQAVYLIDEETREIIVRAQLSPLTSRLRLEGTAGQKYGMAGLKSYTNYDITSNTFTTSTDKLSGTIGTNGSSGYAYVLFADDAARKLTADALDTSGKAIGKACFVRTFGTSVLAPATSGYLTLPTVAQLGAWTLANTDNGKEITLPTVSAVTAGQATYSSAPVSATVSNLGNGTLLAVGFVYAKTQNPDLSSQRVTATTSSSFSTRITGLDEQSTYYVRAFATNERGTTLGEQQVVKTTVKPEGSSFDRSDFGEETEW